MAPPVAIAAVSSSAYSSLRTWHPCRRTKPFYSIVHHQRTSRAPLPGTKALCPGHSANRVTLHLRSSSHVSPRNRRRAQRTARVPNTRSLWKSVGVA
uniref:Secreted protein n=1 Tax=Knipowitschia caucasica TaxID=637954 RepID=A0AAV2L965_KNICA